MILCCYTEITREWSEPELADKLAMLPGELRQQALRKRRWEDRQLSISGKLLLLKLIEAFKSKLTLSDLRYNTFHRPFFESGFDFNIAHSGNRVVCCGNDSGLIGIDIEEIKEIDLEDYTDYFTLNEWGKINQHPNQFDGFYDFWTRKEAVLKAIGSGFHTPLSSVDVADESMIYDDIAYYIQSLDIDQKYKCHIATTETPSDIWLLSMSL